MKKIAVITDSDASLPTSIADELGITLVPITINFGEDNYTTGLDIDDEKLFALIDQHGKLPTTAAPAPAAFTAAFEKSFAAGAEAIVCVCVSSQISATYNAAKMAAETFPERDIRVIDSLTLTLGQGFMVIRAAEMAREGVGVDEIVETVEGMRGRLHVFAALSTLKYLAMGGRMGKFTAGMADTLNIKPVLTVVDGKLEMLEKIRTKHKATKRVLELIENAVDGKPIEQIGIIHAADRAGAENYQTMLHELFPAYQGDVLIAPFTPGLSVHAGAGFAGVVILTEE